MMETVEPWQWLFSAWLELDEHADPFPVSARQAAARALLGSRVGSWLPAWTSDGRALARARRCLRRHIARIQAGKTVSAQDWSALASGWTRVADLPGIAQRLSAQLRVQGVEHTQDLVAEVAQRLALQLPHAMLIWTYLRVIDETDARRAAVEQRVLDWQVPEPQRAQCSRLYTLLLRCLQLHSVVPTAVVHQNVGALFEAAELPADREALEQAYAELIDSLALQVSSSTRSLQRVSEFATQLRAWLDSAPPRLKLQRAAARLLSQIGVAQLRTCPGQEALAAQHLTAALAYDPTSADAADHVSWLGRLPDELQVQGARSRDAATRERLKQRADDMRSAASTADAYLQSADADKHRERFVEALNAELYGLLNIEQISAEPARALRMLISTIDEVAAELRGSAELATQVAQTARRRLGGQHKELLLLDWGRIAQGLRKMSEPSGALLALALAPAQPDASANWQAEAVARHRAKRPKLVRARPARWRLARAELPYVLAAGFGLCALALSVQIYLKKQRAEQRRAEAYRALQVMVERGSDRAIIRSANQLLSGLAPTDPRYSYATSQRAEAALRSVLALNLEAKP